MAEWQAIELDSKSGSTYRIRGLTKQKKGDAMGAPADFARAKQLASVRSL